MISIINKTQEPISNQGPHALIEQLIKYFILPEQIIVEIVFVDNAQMTKLNKEYRNKNQSTNVLSFPQVIDLDNNIPQILGSIYICPDYIFNQDQSDNITKYIIHGFLHLVGFDHSTDDSEEKFYEEFSKISKKLKLRDMY